MNKHQEIGMTENTVSKHFLSPTSESEEYSNKDGGYRRRSRGSHVWNNPNAKVNWREILEEFSLNTTLHGVRHIVRSDAFVIRR